MNGSLEFVNFKYFPGNTAVAKVLIQYEVDVKKTNIKGEKPRDAAVKGGKI